MSEMYCLDIPTVQWGLWAVSSSPYKIQWPINATLLKAFACDGGNGNHDIGIDNNGKVYSEASQIEALGVAAFGVFIL